MENERTSELDNSLVYNSAWVADDLKHFISDESGLIYEKLVDEINKLNGKYSTFDNFDFDTQYINDLEFAEKNVQEAIIAEQNKREEDEEYQQEREAIEEQEGRKDVETLIVEEMLRNKEDQLGGLIAKYEDLLDALESLGSDEDTMSLLENHNINWLHSVFGQDKEQFGTEVSANMLLVYLMAKNAEKEDE